MWGLSACVGWVGGVGEGAVVGLLVGDGLGRWVAVCGAQAESTHRESTPARRGFTPPDTTIRGGVRLQGGVWEMDIQPEHGGRIISVRLAGEALLGQGVCADAPPAVGVVAARAAGGDRVLPGVGASPD